ncbi:hypothetical protein Leryth_026555 [Lithospermum erythrorhizon]|nr:hypothetical protein Leryth_026555 [Lithospermum erythrorhizon]
MEVAIIDWKRIDSRYVKDEVLESINAPQWVDFDAQDDPLDDEAWFCRPECNHPKTIDDFKESSPSPKRLVSLSEMHPLGERNIRDTNLKKRGIVQPSVFKNKWSRWDKIGEDSENLNPNLATLPSTSKTNKFLKQGIKSSANKTNAVEESNLHKEKTPSLRRTMSAKNLFGGGDILTKISEFCNELKKLALKAKERETDVEKPDEFSHVDKGRLNDMLTDLEIKERTPLLDMSKGNKTTMLKNKLQPKQREILRYDDAENTPISIDVKSTRNKYDNSIRTNPPTPQCFSAGNEQPPKVFRSKPLLQEQGILRELTQRNRDEEKEVYDGIKSNHHHVHGKQTSIIAEKEAKTLDVFWFLKPCTL